MADFLHALLTASLSGGVVIAVILLLRLLLRKAPKKYICLLWLLAAVRLLLPFQVESSLSLQPEFLQDVPVRLEQTVTPPIQTPEATPGEDSATPEPSLPTLPPAVTTPTEPPVTAPIVETPAPTPEKTPVNPFVILGWVWATVAVGLLTYSALSYLRLRRRVANAVILSEGIWVTKLHTAMVLGFFRPQIYLSAGLDETQRSFVLRHEQCHIRRGDHLWKPLGFLVLAIHWFNPLVWLGYLLLCRDLEMACDEAVIQHLDIAQRKSYSAALLSCSAHKPSIAACPVAFGEVSVKARIKNVLHYKKPTFWIILVSIIALAVVAVCFLTSPKPQTQAPPAADDWGITVSAENITTSSVTFYITQTGAAPEAGYSYDQIYTLEIWNGSAWETVEPITPPIFTKELLWLNLNGQTNIHIDWAPFYGQLSDGYYRIGKVVTDSATKTARTYHISFQLGEGGGSAAVLSQEAVLTMFYNKMDQLKATGRHHLLHEYAVETDFPYLTGFTVEEWYADGKWYLSRENRFTDGTAYYEYMNAGGDTYVRCWSDNVPGMVNLDWHVRDYTYSTIGHKDWRALELGKFISEKTEDGMVYTIVLLTGATGDVTEPIYENYYTIHMDENANILGMRCYVHGKFYHSGWGRSGYWDTKYDITITILDPDTETLNQKIDAAMDDVQQPTITPTPEALAFNELFSPIGSWYNMALIQHYSDPTEMSLKMYFDFGFPDESRTPTAEEWAELEGMEGFREEYDLIRLPVSKMNAVLTQYFGLTLEDMSERSFSGLVYLESTNCYYFMTTGAFHSDYSSAISLETLEDGTLRLYYFCGNGTSPLFVVTMVPNGEGYRILSNLPA